MYSQMKKKLIALLTVGVLALSSFAEGWTGPLIVNAATTAVYVDAAAGDDSNPGSLDQPVKTLAKAQELARSMTASQSADVTVYLRGGTYVLDNTLTFDANDSGKNGYKVIWTAYGSEKPVISGGTALTGWTKEDADKNIWSAAVPSDLTSRDFYVDGVRATLARQEMYTVNYVYSEAYTEWNYKSNSVRDTLQQLSRTVSLGIAESGTPDSFARPQDLEVVMRAGKNWSVLPVESVATEGGIHTLTIEEKAWKALWTLGEEDGEIYEDGYDADWVKYVQNAYEFLDQPGEWYLNTETDTVYYIPKSGQDMGTSSAVLGRLENLFVLNGTENVTFEGLTFANTTWLQAGKEEGMVSAKNGGILDGTGTYPSGLLDMSCGAAVFATNVNNVSVTGNTFEHMGYGGVYLDKGTKNSRITGNTLNDLGGTAVALGSIQTSQMAATGADLTENNVVSDNTISNFGAEYKSCAGILIGSAARTTVEYNTISNGAGRGIILNSWDGTNAGTELLNRTCVTTDNRVAHNLIDTITNESDMSIGIYAVGRMDRTVITGNVMEMVPTGAGAGIYLDKGACGFAVTNNVMADCQTGIRHYGDYNNIYDNYNKAVNTSSGDKGSTVGWKDEDDNSPTPLGTTAVGRFENNGGKAGRWDDTAVNALKAAAGVSGRAASYTDPTPDIPALGSGGSGESGGPGGSGGGETSGPDIPAKPNNTAKADVPADAFKIYVDAVNGNDSNAGTLESPLKTLAKAKELAATKTVSQSQDVAVLLREGTYVLEDTLTFTGSDSGKNGYKVIWAAYEDENPVVSGGTTITGWTLVDADKNIWAASAQGLESRDFYVNGERAVRARSKDIDALLLQSSKREITVAKTDLPTSFARLQDLEVVITASWKYQIKRVESVNTEGEYTVVKVTEESWIFDKDTNVPVGKKDVQFFENAYELMDEPGEWYLNADEDKIYYIPQAGQDVNSLDTVLGRLENLIVFDGDVDNVVENITFEGLTFSYTTWLWPNGPRGLHMNQASALWSDTSERAPIPTTSSSIYGTYVNNISITNNIFQQLGNGGVDLGRATKNSSIAYNVFEGLGAGAVVLGRFEFVGIDQHPETNDPELKALTENNAITDNYIKDVCQTYKACTGILVGFTARSTIEHNTLINLPYTGISAGWGWGHGDWTYDDFVLGESSISYNYIVDVMNTLDDGGAIYVLGRQDDTQIVGNYISHSGDIGIYLDAGAWGYSAIGNVVTNTARNFRTKVSGAEVRDNYTTKGEEDDTRLDDPQQGPARPTDIFDRNDLWDDTEVAAIKTAAGARVMPERDTGDGGTGDGGTGDGGTGDGGTGDGGTGKDESEAEEPGIDAPEEESDNAVWIYVAVLALLLAALGVVIVYLKKRQSERQ